MAESIFDEILGNTKKKPTKRQVMQNIGGAINLISQTPKLTPSAGGVLGFTPQILASKGNINYSEIPTPAPIPPSYKPQPVVPNSISRIPEQIVSNFNPWEFASNPATYPINLISDAVTGNKLANRQQKEMARDMAGQRFEDLNYNYAKKAGDTVRSGVFTEKDKQELNYLDKMRKDAFRDYNKENSNLTPDLMTVNEYGKALIKTPFNVFSKTAVDTLKKPSLNFGEQYFKNLTESNKWTQDASQKPIGSNAYDYGIESAKNIKNPFLRNLVQGSVAGAMLAVENLPETLAWKAVEGGDNLLRGQGKGTPPSPKEPPLIEKPIPVDINQTNIIPKPKFDVSKTQKIPTVKIDKSGDTAIFGEPIKPSVKTQILNPIEGTAKQLDDVIKNPTPKKISDISKTIVGDVKVHEPKLYNKIESNIKKNNPVIQEEERAFTTDVVVKEIDQIEDAVKLINPKIDIAKTIVGKEAKQLGKQLQDSLKQLRLNPETKIPIDSQNAVASIINPAIKAEQMVSTMSPNVISAVLKELNKVDPVGVVAILSELTGTPANFEEIYKDLEAKKIKISKPIINNKEIDRRLSPLLQQGMQQEQIIPPTEQSLLPEPTQQEPYLGIPLPSTEEVISTEEPKLLPEPQAVKPPQMMPYPEGSVPVPQKPLALPELQEKEAVMPKVETGREKGFVELPQKKEEKQSVLEFIDGIMPKTNKIIWGKVAIDKNLEIKKWESNFNNKESFNFDDYFTYNNDEKRWDISIEKEFEEDEYKLIIKDNLYNDIFEEDFDSLREAKKESVDILNELKQKTKDEVLEDINNHEIIKKRTLLLEGKYIPKTEKERKTEQKKERKIALEKAKSEKIKSEKEKKANWDLIFKSADKNREKINPTIPIAEAPVVKPKPEAVVVEEKPAEEPLPQQEPIQQPLPPTKEEVADLIKNARKKVMEKINPPILKAVEKVKTKTIKGKKPESVVQISKVNIMRTMKQNKIPEDKVLTFVIKNNKVYLNDFEVDGAYPQEGKEGSSFSINPVDFKNIKSKGSEELLLKAFKNAPVLVYKKSTNNFVTSLESPSVEVSAGFNFVKMVEDIKPSAVYLGYLNEQQRDIIQRGIEDVKFAIASSIGMLEDSKAFIKEHKLTESDLEIITDVMRNDFSYDYVLNAVDGNTKKADILYNEAVRLETTFSQLVKDFIQEFGYSPEQFRYYGAYVPERYNLIELSNAHKDETKKLVKALEKQTDRSEQDELLLKLGKAILNKDDRIKLRDNLQMLKESVKVYEKNPEGKKVLQDTLSETEEDVAKIEEDVSPPIGEQTDLVYVRSPIYGSLKGKYISLKDYDRLFKEIKLLSLAEKQNIGKGKSKVAGSLSENYLMKRKDLTDDYKDFLGFKAGLSNYVFKAIANIQANQAKLRLFNRLHDAGFASVDNKEITQGEINVLVKENWGKLKDKYIPQNLYNELADMQQVYEPPSLADKFLNFWKIAKTVLQTATHARNFIANVSIYGVAKPSWNAIPDMLDSMAMFYNASRGKTSNEMQFYKDLGLVNTTMLDVIEKANPMAEFEHLSEMGKYDLNNPEGIAENIASFFKWFYKTATSAYKAEDEIFKVMVAKSMAKDLQIDLDFIKNNWKSFDIKDRKGIIRLFQQNKFSEHIKDIIPSYDKLPKAIREMSYKWWGEPFVAYPVALITRTIKEILNTKPYKFNLSGSYISKDAKEADFKGFDEMMKEYKKLTTESLEAKKEINKLAIWAKPRKQKYTAIRNTIVKNLDKASDAMSVAKIKLEEAKLQYMAKINNEDAITKTIHAINEAKYEYKLTKLNDPGLRESIDTFLDYKEEYNYNIKARKQNKKSFIKLEKLEIRLTKLAMRYQFLYNKGVNMKSEERRIKTQEKMAEIEEKINGLINEIGEEELKIEEIEKTSNLKSRMDSAGRRIDYIRGQQSITARKFMEKYGTEVLRNLNERLYKLLGQRKILNKKWMEEYGSRELRTSKERLVKTLAQQKILNRIYNKHASFLTDFENRNNRRNILEERVKNIDERKEELKKAIESTKGEKLSADLLNGIFFGKNYTGKWKNNFGGGNGGGKPPNNNNFSFDETRGEPNQWFKIIRLALWLLSPAIIGYTARSKAHIDFLEDYRTRLPYQTGATFNYLYDLVNNSKIEVPSVVMSMFMDLITGYVPIGRDEEGNIIYFDTGYVLPIYSLKRYADTFINGIGSVFGGREEVPLSFLNNPFYRLLSDIIYNKSAFSQQPIYINYQDSDITFKIAEYATKTLMPSLLGGAGTFKIISAMKGELYKGKKQKPLDIVASELFGFKLNRQNEIDSTDSREVVYKIRQGEFKKELNRIRRNYDNGILNDKSFYKREDTILKDMQKLKDKLESRFQMEAPEVEIE